MTTELQVRVNQDAPRAAGEDALIDLKGSKRGEMCVVDFYTAMALEGRMFAVRAGSVSAPLVGDAPLADTAAEMTVDAVSGYTIIPTFFNVAANLLTGTVAIVTLKAVGAASSGGAAFTPLNLLIGGASAVTTGRVAAAGGCTVAAEVVTTTRRIYGAANGIAAGAYTTTWQWKARLPHILTGIACLYAQIGATTTGPSYFATIEYIELPTANI